MKLNSIATRPRVKPQLVRRGAAVEIPVSFQGPFSLIPMSSFSSPGECFERRQPSTLIMLVMVFDPFVSRHVDGGIQTIRAGGDGQAAQAPR